MDHPTYLQTCAGAGIKTSVSFMDRRDLLDYINGVSADSVNIVKADQKSAVKASSGPGDRGTNELSKLFGFDLPGKRAALPSSVRDDFQVIKKLKTLQRTINTTSNILSVQNTKVAHLAFLCC
jgi:hypothetical protein